MYLDVINVAPQVLPSMVPFSESIFKTTNHGIGSGASNPPTILNIQKKIFYKMLIYWHPNLFTYDHWALLDILGHPGYNQFPMFFPFSRNIPNPRPLMEFQQLQWCFDIKTQLKRWTYVTFHFYVKMPLFNKDLLLIKQAATTSMAGSCAIDFQTESVLALNKKLKVNGNFKFFF